MRTGQGGDLHRVVHHEGWLHQAGLHALLEGLVEQAADAVGLGGYLQAGPLHGGGGLLAAVEGIEIKPRGVPHQLVHGDPAPGRGEIHIGPLVGDAGVAALLQYGGGDRCIGEVHQLK